MCGYYCNVCKKGITEREYQYSINKFRKALCEDHQRDERMSGATKDLQGLTRNRHKDDLTKEIPNLKTVKDWIKADLETWDKVLKKEGDDQYIIKTSEEDTKHSYSSHIKSKEKSKIPARRVKSAAEENERNL